jgi:hypothetical protein
MKKIKSFFVTFVVLLGFVQLPELSNALTACNPTPTTDGSRTILTFTSTTACDWTVPANVLAIDVLVVGGGGGGGYERGGGGGGGGVAYTAALTVSPAAVHAITVGAGGTAATSATEKGGDGGTSSFVRSTGSVTLVQAGGGGGGGTHNGAQVGIGDGRPGVNASAQVSAGGSGGGSAFNFRNGTDLWFFRGAAGGTGNTNGFNGTGSYYCDLDGAEHDTVRLTGGGGGASQVGSGGASGAESPSGCNTFVVTMRPRGGDGTLNSISGTSVSYGGGGGGADARVGGETRYRSLGSGPGGLGGGGRGQQVLSSSLDAANNALTATATAVSAQNGTDGLGGGGGGGITAAGRGGNGVVIISYAALIFSSTTPAQDSTYSVNPSATNSNIGISLEGEVSGTEYLVSISSTNMPTGTTLKLSDVTGGTAAFGFPALSTSNNFTNLSFTVTGANIDTILGSMQIVTGSTAGNPTISITVTQSQSGLAYNSRNGHFYRAVTGTITRNNAASAAANVSNVFGGRTGYLVTITDDFENDFVASQIQNAQNIWIGASDAGTEGLWIWDQGPENGTAFWRHPCVSNGTGSANSCGTATGVSPYDGESGVWQNFSTTNHNKWCGVNDGRQTNQTATEPNNAYGSTGEDYAVTNWFGGTNSYSVDGAASTTHSCWNDLDNSFDGSIGGYLIEWGDATPFNNTFSRSFSVKFNQSITLVTAPAANGSVSSETTTFNATVSSGLTLSYLSSDSSVCTVASTANSGANVTVTLLRANANCSITISQAGNTNFNAATSVTRTFLSLFGRVTSCTGVGSLQNGGFETLPVTTSNVATSGANSTDYVWHGYVSPTHYSEPRQFLFLGAANSSKTTKISSWNASIVGSDNGASEGWVEIQRQISGYAHDGTAAGVTAYYDKFNPAPAEGSYFAELNAKVEMGLYQDISTIPGTTIRWSIKHRGRSFTGPDVMKVRIGSTSSQAEQTSLQKKVQDTATLWTEPTFNNNSFTSVSTISDELDTGWAQYTGAYTVPADQTTTRFIFESVSGDRGAAIGNYLDDIVFTPLIACPATFTVVKGRTVNLNPFDLDNDRSGAGVDPEDSFGWSDATISNSGLSASGGATVERTTYGGVSNRAIRYTAPSSTGAQTIDFTITNPQGDTSSSRLTINVVDEASVRNINTLPIDPQATSYNLRSFTIDSGPEAVIACINAASNSSGTLTSGILIFDVGNIGTTDSSLTISSNTVTIIGDRSDAMTMTGNLSAVNSLIGGLQVARVGGGRFSTAQYIRIRSVPSITIGQLSCSDALASADRTLTISPLALTRSRTAIVTIN